MSTLLLRFAAPLQSWGTSSRFVRRNTDRAPSRSGIIGLLAAAQGRLRTDPLDELLELKIGVRVDQAGQIERDFQTARTRDGSKTMPLSYRFYLADAVFAVAIEGKQELLMDLQKALCAPVFPLFLGRRSCPPAGKLVYDIQDGNIEQRLQSEPWLASHWIRSRHKGPVATLDTIVDCKADEPEAVLIRDQPISFDPRERSYEWRTVRHIPVTVSNPSYLPSKKSMQDSHDPFGAFEENS